jgi:hypothetical protein
MYLAEAMYSLNRAWGNNGSSKNPPLHVWSQLFPQQGVMTTVLPSTFPYWRMVGYYCTGLVQSSGQPPSQLRGYVGISITLDEGCRGNKNHKCQREWEHKVSSNYVQCQRWRELMKFTSKALHGYIYSVAHQGIIFISSYFRIEGRIFLMKAKEDNKKLSWCLLNSPIEKVFKRHHWYPYLCIPVCMTVQMTVWMTVWIFTEI